MRAPICLPLACVALSSLAHSQSTLFVGTSIQAAPNPWFLIDPDAGAVLTSGQSPRTDGCYGAKFHPRSGDLVVTSLTQEDISAASMTSGAPDFAAPLFQESLGARPYRLLYDPNFDRFLTVSNDFPASQSDVYLIEGDPAAPNYGSKTDEVAIDSIEGYSISEDGTLFASVPLFFAGSLTMLDIDPNSSTYLQSTVAPSPGVQGTTFGLTTMISPDNRYVTVVLPTFLDILILKYDRMAAQWIDTDPTTPGLQHLTVPLAFAMHFSQIPGTETGLMVGTDNGIAWIAKLDTTGPPSNWSLNQLSVFGGFPNAFALSPDGTRFAITTEPEMTLPARVLIGDAASGSVSDVVTMPTNPRNMVTLAWGDGPVAVGTVYCDPAAVNSTGQPATISANGSEVASSNDVEIVLDALPPNTFGILLASQVQGFEANPGGSQGNLCLGGAIGRYTRPGEIRQADASGRWSLELDLTTTPQPSGFVAVQGGETWNYQAWFRDSVAGMATSNFTPGLSIDYQ